MKKFLAVAICFISIHSIAQKRNTQFSIAGEGAVMTTNQAFSVYNLGFGGSAKVLFPTGKKDFITGTFGVIAFSGRSGSAREVFKELIGGGSTGIAPIDSLLNTINVAHPSLTVLTPKIGYKHFFTSKFNAEVEAGYCIAFVKKIYDAYPGNIGGYDFSIGCGFMVSKKLDIGLRYEQFQSTASQRDFTSYLALRTLLNIDL